MQGIYLDRANPSRPNKKEAASWLPLFIWAYFSTPLLIPLLIEQGFSARVLFTSSAARIDKRW